MYTLTISVNIFTFKFIFIYETKPKSWIWSSYLDETRKQMWILAFRYILAIWLAVCWLFFIVLITSSSTWHILDLGHKHFSILALSDKELFLCVGAGAMKNYPDCLWLSNSNEIIIEGCVNLPTAENTPKNIHANIFQEVFSHGPQKIIFLNVEVSCKAPFNILYLLQTFLSSAGPSSPENLSYPPTLHVQLVLDYSYFTTVRILLPKIHMKAFISVLFSRK